MRRSASPFVLVLAFATFVQLVVVLAGRLPAAPLVFALVLGVLVVALLVTPSPLRHLRALGRDSAVLAAAGGLLAVFGAPALLVGSRMSDAPSGSIVVFLMTGGWAAAAAIAGVALALREGRRLSASWTLAGALLSLAGAAGVVACWERPSSFSPFVRFPIQEVAMLLGGLLLVAGGSLLVRVARASDHDGALICAASAAVVASLAWWALSGTPFGWAPLAEVPLAVGVAALAWGLVCGSWVDVLRHRGPSVAAACIAVGPLLLSALALLEQAVGVAGPQPLVVPGVIAGSLVSIAGCTALAHSAGARRAARNRVLSVAAGVPAILAVVALALPAIAVTVSVTVAGGEFSGSWSLNGVESVVGWCALALSVLVLVGAFDAAPFGPVAAGLVAFAALPWLADVPTHVWSAALAPEIQHYYGTEYGSIAFTALPDLPMIGAAGLGIVLLLVIMVLRRGPLGRAANASTNDGGS